MKRVLAIMALVTVASGVVYGLAVTQREASYRHFVEQGDAALARDDSYAAIEAFSVAISLKADSMVPHLKRGEAYRRRGEFDAAVRDLRRAADIDALAVYPRELLGDVHYAVAAADGAAAAVRFRRAVEQYRESVALDNRSARLQYKLGLALYRAGRLPAAIGALNEALRLDPRFAEAHFVLGVCLRASRRPADAVRSLERAVELAPSLVPALEELADLHAALRQYEARIPHLKTLATLQPVAARERAVGLAYVRAGNLDRAVGQLARTAQRHPDDTETYVALGRLWLDRAAAGGRVELSKALEALHNGVGNESTSEALTLLGRALLLSGNLARAEQTLQQAVTRFPVAAPAFLYLSQAAERRGHVRIAHRALLDYAALVRPDSFGAPLLVRLGEAHLQTGDLEAARTAVDAALEKEPDNSRALSLKARLK